MTNEDKDSSDAVAHHVFEHVPCKADPAPIQSNVAISNLGLGGAERIVYEQFSILAKLPPDRAPTETRLFVLSPRHPSLIIPSLPPRLEVTEADPAGRKFSLAHLIANQAACKVPLICHLFDSEALQALWSSHIRTIVVFHNVREGWRVTPSQLPKQRVPLVIAVSEAIRHDLLEEGCDIPVHVLKHFAYSKHKPETWPQLRKDVRNRYDIRQADLLVGMVGNLKRQKNYAKAIRVLQQLNAVKPSYLMICGGCDSYDQHQEKKIIKRLARKYRVADRLILKGYTKDPDAYYPAFDVFLNTSDFEGLSIATRKASYFGCPVVSADVGGQREAAKEPQCLLSRDASARKYATAVLSLDDTSHGSLRAEPIKHSRTDCAVLLPMWLANFGTQRSEKRQGGVLFVTSTLRQGGAQRSLTNLLSYSKPAHYTEVCVLKDGVTGAYVDRLRAANVDISSAAADSITTSIQTLLRITDDLRISTICYWNADVRVKLLLAKILFYRDLRFIDVSPGPKLFRELDSAEPLGDLISFTPKEYLCRLSHFVSKYKISSVPEKYSYILDKMTVIPNGVPDPQKVGGYHPVQPPSSFGDPRHAAVTCCRLTPDKKIIELLRMASLARDQLSTFTLTIVGGVEDQDRPYWDEIKTEMETLSLAHTVFFAGPHTDVFEFLDGFAAFVMLSVAQGCPNASLEAMAAGLPVVANGDGGTAEQVLEGITGFLVEGLDIEAMARKLVVLLRNDNLKDKMGRAGRMRAKAEFSMQIMAARYKEILWDTDGCVRTA